MSCQLGLIAHLVLTFAVFVIGFIAGFIFDTNRNPSEPDDDL